MKRVNIFENIFGNRENKSNQKPFGEFLNGLFSQGLYVEAFLYYSLEMEEKLKLSIRICEMFTLRTQKSSIKNVFKNKSHSDQIKFNNNLEKPLGPLIDRFALNCNDKKLILELREFNKLRRKVFHKLLSEDRDKINQEIQDKLPIFYNLILRVWLHGAQKMQKATEDIIGELNKKMRK